MSGMFEDVMNPTPSSAPTLPYPSPSAARAAPVCASIVATMTARTPADFALAIFRPFCRRTIAVARAFRRSARFSELQAAGGEYRKFAEVGVVAGGDDEPGVAADEE